MRLHSIQPPILQRPLRSFWPWLGLVGALALTGMTWLLVRHAGQARLRDLEAAQVNSMVERIESRMSALEQVLRGATGYMGRSPLPTRPEWRSYVDNLNLPASYPGIQAISFVEWIPEGTLGNHLQRVRREGFPEYQITSGGPLPPLPEGRSSILYLEPQDARNQRAFGKDMLADPVRREAMFRARDTGLPSLTSKLVLYQETGIDPQVGAILFAPVYRQGALLDTISQRRKALIGWASIPLRMGDLLLATLIRDRSMAEFELYDGTGEDPGRLLFDSNPSLGPMVSGEFLARTITVAGRDWVIRVRPSSTFYGSVGNWRHLEILFGGLSASLLLFALLVSVKGSENRARKLAYLRGEELLATELRFRALFEKAPLGMAILDAESGRFQSVNPHLAQTLGYTVDELLERTFLEVTHPEQIQVDLESVRQVAAGKVSDFRKQKRYIHKDGHLVWGQVIVARLPFSEGASIRLLALVEDITESRRMAEAAEQSAAFTQSILDSIPATIAVLDPTGLITQVNQRWMTFAQDNGAHLDGVGLGVGINYRSAFPVNGDETSAEMRQGLEAVMAGRLASYRQEYECATGGAQGWYQMLAVPIQGHPGCLVAHFEITPLKAAEQIARSSEMRLRILGDQLQDSFIYQYVATEGMPPRFIHVSAGIERLCGVRVEDVLRDAAVLLGQMDPELVPEYLKREAACAKDHIAFEMDIRQRRPDGQWRWFRVRSVPRAMPDGTVVWEGISTDVTEQVLSQKALEDSEARFRSLADQAPVLIWISDTQGQCTWFNKTWQDFTGRPLEADLGMGWAELVHPDDLADYLALDRSREGSLEPCSAEFRLRNLRGEYRWMVERGNPRFGPSGDYLGRIGACSDVNDQKEAEARFRRVFEYAADAMFVHDESGRMLLANRQACLSTGYTLEELTGMNVLDIDLESRDQRDGVVWKGLAPGQQAHLIGRHRRKNGSVFPAEVHVGLLSEGPPRQVLAIVRDLCEQEKARALDLRARKAESLVLMAGGIAHDFNNLFQALQGNLEMAELRARLDPALANPLQRAKEILHQAVNLSWKMLDFSGHGFLRMQSINLSEWLPGCVGRLQEGSAPGLRVELACEVVPHILVDEAKLEQVLKALVDNAREAAEAGEPRVSIRLYVDFGEDHPGPESPGAWPLDRPTLPATVCLEVTDEGAGVPADLMDRICDPFFTTRQQGRGLGWPLPSAS